MGKTWRYLWSRLLSGGPTLHCGTGSHLAVTVAVLRPQKACDKILISEYSKCGCCRDKHQLTDQHQQYDTDAKPKGCCTPMTLYSCSLMLIHTLKAEIQFVFSLQNLNADAK